MVKGLFGNEDYPEINYKRAMGIIQLKKLYGAERLNNACKRAVEAEIFSYLRLKNILENNLDQVEPELDLNNSESHIPRHANTRGESHYS